VSGNVVQNPSLETNIGNPPVPTNWFQVAFGTGLQYSNTYVSGGAHLGTWSGRTEITAAPNAGSGAAWSMAQVPVSAGQTYTYSGWYKSSITSEVLAVFSSSTGVVGFQVLGNPAPAANWTQFTASLDVPAGTTLLNVYQNISTVGWVQVDDQALVLLPAGVDALSRPLISLTFDDGTIGHWNVAKPKLDAVGLKGTFYLITSYLTDGDPNQMTAAQAQALFADGMQLASHTVTHPHLNSLTATQRRAELQNSRTYLQNLIGQQVIDFASPYGEYNGPGVLADIVATYPGSHRTVESGTQGKQTTDFTRLKARQVLATTTVSQVNQWIADAKSRGQWLILVFHELRSNVNPSNPDDLYDITPTTFNAVVDAVKASGVTVKTVADARVEVAAQR